MVGCDADVASSELNDKGSAAFYLVVLALGASVPVEWTREIQHEISDGVANYPLAFGELELF